MPSKVEQQNAEVLSDGHFRLERIRLQSETFAGPMSRPVTREVLRPGRSVTVLLYDPVEHKFVLTEQFRIGAYLNKLSSFWLLECVAGMVDEGETPEVAARREVQEETGCDVLDLEFVGDYLTSPGITDELTTLFVGRIESARAGGVHGKASEAEDILTRILTVDEALAAADGGTLIDITAQLAVLWFARHGQRLRERWLSAMSSPEGQPDRPVPTEAQRDA